MSKLISKAKSFFLSSIKVLPVLAGAAAPFIKTTPTGRNLVKDVMDGRIDNFLYDSREVFTGVDANGVFHGDWVAGTYAPVVVGLVVSKIVEELV